MPELLSLLLLCGPAAGSVVPPTTQSPGEVISLCRTLLGPADGALKQRALKKLASVHDVRQLLAKESGKNIPFSREMAGFACGRYDMVYLSHNGLRKDARRLLKLVRVRKVGSDHQAARIRDKEPKRDKELSAAFRPALFDNPQSVNDTEEGAPIRRWVINGSEELTVRRGDKAASAV